MIIGVILLQWRGRNCRWMMISHVRAPALIWRHGDVMPFRAVKLRCCQDFQRHCTCVRRDFTTRICCTVFPARNAITVHVENASTYYCSLLLSVAAVFVQCFVACVRRICHSASLCIKYLRVGFSCVLQHLQESFTRSTFRAKSC